MHNYRRRLARLESRAQRRILIPIAQELGLTVEALLQEAEEFLSQPLEQQLAEVDEIAAEMLARGEPWPELGEVKAVLIREYRPCG